MTNPLRIAVADDDADMRLFLERFIPLLGHKLSSVASTGAELVEQCRAAVPDLIVTDVKMPGLSGLEAVEAVSQFAAVPSILLTGHPDRAVTERLRDRGVMAYLVKPVTEDDLAPAIALAHQQFVEVRQLRKEAAELRQSLEDRKLIERAKGAVTRRVGLAEADAYTRLRRLATNSNRRLAEIAQQVLAAEDVFRTIEELGRN